MELCHHLEVISEGTVVVVDTGQVGTVIENVKNTLVVFLTDGYLWRGLASQAYIPTSPEELELAVKNVDHFENRTKPTKQRSA